jgi:hypothetical protein
LEDEKAPVLLQRVKLGTDCVMKRQGAVTTIR